MIVILDLVQDALRIEVEGKPVPWSAPDVGISPRNHRRYARKNPALTNWQKDVSRAAKEVCGAREPWSRLVGLRLVFRLPCTDESLEGQIVCPDFRWAEARGRLSKTGMLPDMTNLAKAVEDALNGIVYEDDTQVRFSSGICIWSKTPGVEIDVSLVKEVPRIKIERPTSK